MLVPWSNRISGSGFLFAGKFHSLQPNLPGEPYPIHGNGFSSAWSVENTTPTSAELSLMSDGPGPFRYAARASYALNAGALTMRLGVVNHAAEPLPFGLGFHPWIVRTSETLLQAKAKSLVLETSDHLPSGKAQVTSRSGWNFAEPRRLPDDWINNAFLNWDGRALVQWLERRLALELAADPPLTVYIVYSPSRERTSSASSRSRTRSTRTTRPAARRPMASRSLRRRSLYRLLAAARPGALTDEGCRGSSPIDVTEIGEADKSTGEAWFGNTADAKIVNGKEAAAEDAVARKPRQRELRH